MKFQDFKSGTFTKHDGYKAFLPSTINHSWEWEDTEINLLLEKASAELGGLNSFAELIPDIEIYIAMHIYNEANKSSRIEGTKTTIEEDLLPIEDILPEKRNDYIEVKNYIHALNYGIERVKGGFPLCNRLLREIHKILLLVSLEHHKTGLAELVLTMHIMFPLMFLIYLNYCQILKSSFMKTTPFLIS